jgi:hypothetical protein
MHDRSPRSRHLAGSGGRGHWAAWLPLVFAGSMMFWTVAVVLGGWSLMVVSDGAVEVAAPPPATALEPKPGVEGQGAGGMVDRISVQMEESQEPEDVNDNAGSVVGVDSLAGLPASTVLPAD